MATEKWLKEMALGLKSTLPELSQEEARVKNEKIEERKRKTKIAIISNINGNMEAHKTLKKQGYNVKSFGSGAQVMPNHDS